MQVVTTVKTTIQEVQKALRLLNPNLPTEFVLDIDIECNAEVDKVSSVEQATEDSNAWIDVPKYWSKPYCPTNINKGSLIDVGFRCGKENHSVSSLDYQDSWLQENCEWDIVKYRVSKQQ